LPVALTRGVKFSVVPKPLTIELPEVLGEWKDYAEGEAHVIVIGPRRSRRRRRECAQLPNEQEQSAEHAAEEARTCTGTL